MEKTAVLQLRARILARLDRGVAPAAIARELGCSRTTVWKVATARPPAAEDARAANRGRPRLYAEVVRDAVLDARSEAPTAGPRVLYERLRQRATAYGLAASDIPSPSTIARIIHAAGLPARPHAPRELRSFPDTRPQSPGTITLDTWGPWRVRAATLYLATVQDRYTRLTAAIPARGIAPGEAPGVVPGFTGTTWARAVLVAQQYLSAGLLHAVYCDNAVGMAPALGVLPPAVRTVLAAGARVVFIPPRQPWRNGRLERVHWTLEREFFREEQPSSMAAALAGLTAFLNLERPHMAFGYRAPGEVYPFARPLPDRFWAVPVPQPRTPASGLVEAIRLVYTDGTVDTWGRRLRLSPALAGQYVRVQFTVTGGIGPGRVLYHYAQGQEIEVATFEHGLDAPGAGVTDWQLYRGASIVNNVEPRPSARLDGEGPAGRHSRVPERRSSGDRQLGDAVETSGEPGL